MSYVMPGMEYYPMAQDAASAGSDLPQLACGGWGGGVHASGSYTGSFDVGTAIIIFAVLWFGSVGALHLLSNGADKL